MQLSTITTSAAPIVWTAKNGKEHQAHGATAQAFAPRASRITAAQAQELTQLSNGQYRPFLRDVAAALTKADVKALQKFGFELAPTNKPGMVKLLAAIAGLWADSKGKRKALCEVAKAFIATMATMAPDSEAMATMAPDSEAMAPDSEAMEPLPTLPEVAQSEAPATATESAPLPVIDDTLI